MSKGENALGELLRSTFQYHRVIPQHPIRIGRKTLYLDYYIPALRLAFEVDGRQHDGFVRFYHGSHQGYARGRDNDELKNRWLEDNGIHLIRFKYNERIDPATLASKIKDATR